MAASKARILAIAFLMIGSILGTLAFSGPLIGNNALAVDRDECDPEATAEVGYREIDESLGESAFTIPPLADVENCDDLVVFQRVYVMESGEPPLVNSFPMGKVALIVESGAFDLLLTKGSGYTLDCQGGEAVPCVKSTFEGGSPSVTLDKGDSAFMEVSDESAESLEFTLTLNESIGTPSSTGTGRLLPAMQPGSGSAKYGGVSTAGAMGKRGACDTGAC